MRHAQNDASIWQESDILGPNVTERETLLTLAKMTNNAYNKPTDEEWYDLGSDWNSVSYGIFPSALIYN
jgi:putative lipase involved disintegration of autophagic bodies